MQNGLLLHSLKLMMDGHPNINSDKSDLSLKSPVCSVCLIVYVSGTHRCFKLHNHFPGLEDSFTLYTVLKDNDFISSGLTRLTSAMTLVVVILMVPKLDRMHSDSMEDNEEAHASQIVAVFGLIMGVTIQVIQNSQLTSPYEP
ncbi:unnamed protein product [Lactuca virosa]|uniref:Uncharacterized protein n=1 Tax=Lactuca virosa TaxID=75947 RepID=A0AAU9MG08_9ASTR|nr:unnamed protein product [Lactuca virosa]